MLLTPEYVFRDVTRITPEFLQQKGICALVLDVDNTITGDRSQQVPPEVAAWFETMRAAGVSLTILSNGARARVQPFAEKLGLRWVSRSAKPLPLGMIVARRRLGVRRVTAVCALLYGACAVAGLVAVALTQLFFARFGGGYALILI